MDNFEVYLSDDEDSEFVHNHNRAIIQLKYDLSLLVDAYESNGEFLLF